jgi:hypothetical protein
MDKFASFRNTYQGTIHGEGSTLFVTTNVEKYQNPSPKLNVMKNSVNAKFILYNMPNNTTTNFETGFMKIPLPYANDKIEIDAFISIGLQTFFNDNTYGYIQEMFPSYIGVIKLADDAFTPNMNTYGETFEVAEYKNNTYIDSQKHSKTFVTKAVNGAQSLGLMLTSKIIGFADIMAHLDYFCTGLYTLSLKTGFAHNDMHCNNILFDTSLKNFVLIDMGSAYIDFDKINLPQVDSQSSITEAQVQQARFEYNEAFAHYFQMIQIMKIDEENVDTVYAEALAIAIAETELKQNRYSDLKKALKGHITNDEIENKLRNACLLLNTDNVINDRMFEKVALKKQCFAIFGDTNHTRYTTPGSDFDLFNRHAAMNDIAGLCLYLFITSDRFKTYIRNNDTIFDIFHYNSLKIPVAIDEIKTKGTPPSILEYGLQWALVYIHTYCRYTCHPIAHGNYYVSTDIMSKHSPLFYTSGQMRTHMFNQLKTDFNETLIDLGMLNGEANPQAGGNLKGGYPDTTGLTKYHKYFGPGVLQEEEGEIPEEPFVSKVVNTDYEENMVSTPQYASAKQKAKPKPNTISTVSTDMLANYENYVETAHLLSIRNVCDEYHQEMPIFTTRINIGDANDGVLIEGVNYHKKLVYDDITNTETQKTDTQRNIGGAPLDRQKSRMIRGVKYVKKGKRMIRAKKMI